MTRTQWPAALLSGPVQKKSADFRLRGWEEKLSLTLRGVSQGAVLTRAEGVRGVSAEVRGQAAPLCTVTPRNGRGSPTSSSPWVSTFRRAKQVLAQRIERALDEPSGVT